MSASSRTRHRRPLADPCIQRWPPTQLRPGALRPTQHHRTRVRPSEAVARYRLPLRQVRSRLPRRRHLPGWCAESVGVAVRRESRPDAAGGAAIPPLTFRRHALAAIDRSEPTAPRGALLAATIQRQPSPRVIHLYGLPAQVSSGATADTPFSSASAATRGAQPNTPIAPAVRGT